MNPDALFSIACRRVEQAAGPQRDAWLRAHGLVSFSPASTPPADAEQRFFDLCRTIAARGRLLEAGLAAGRDSRWLLHPARGLLLNLLLQLALLIAPERTPLNWTALRKRISSEKRSSEVALTLNLLCKTLDIPIGALALDRLELYAWRPRPGRWWMRLLTRKDRAPGRLERLLVRG